jgi:hypothetical protein
MASANAKVKEINLIKPKELSMIIDSLYNEIESMETGNDDFCDFEC